MSSVCICRGHTGNFDWPAFTGVWIIILFVPYGVFNIGQMLLVVSKYTKISPAQRVAVYILSGVLCTLGIAAAWALLLKVQSPVFCRIAVDVDRAGVWSTIPGPSLTYPPPLQPGASLGVDEYWQGDELQIVWGGFILVVFFPLAIFCFAGARKLMKQEHELFLGEKALLLGTSRPPLHPLTPNRFLDNHWCVHPCFIPTQPMTEISLAPKIPTRVSSSQASILIGASPSQDHHRVVPLVCLYLSEHLLALPRVEFLLSFVHFLSLTVLPGPSGGFLDFSSLSCTPLSFFCCGLYNCGARDISC